MSEKVVWQLLQRYAAAVGVPGIAPHAALHLPGPQRIIASATVNRRFDLLDIVGQLSGLALKRSVLAADIVYHFTMQTPVWRNEREMIDNRTVLLRHQ
jgi:hypothetical protein